ncbi:MAG TPA: metallophosphoesterase family protein [Acidobacteriota bacterium]|nr:metallophosphoesterase family protein [Acidobacteriota bacterium]
MKVAALYDIHGNLPALEAVLGEVEGEDVDQVIVGGDVVPGPMPAESLEALWNLAIPVRFIYGNGEQDILALHDGQELTRVPEQFHESMRWVADALPSRHLRELETWPPTLSLSIPGLGEVLFCHATPRDDNGLFTSITPEERLRPLFESAGADVVMCGHTHMQFDRTVAGVRVVNAGSLGMPFGEPGAYWASLSSEGIELRRTEYDFAAASQRIRGTGYPTQFVVEHPPSAEDMLKLFESAAGGRRG